MTHLSRPHGIRGNQSQRSPVLGSTTGRMLNILQEEPRGSTPTLASHSLSPRLQTSEPEEPLATHSFSWSFWP